MPGSKLKIWNSHLLHPASGSTCAHSWLCFLWLLCMLGVQTSASKIWKDRIKREEEKRKKEEDIV